MDTDNYVRKSLDLHLFFGRIMKEHSLFLKAGFTPVNFAYAERAEYFKKAFENLLYRAISLSNGIVSKDVLDSGELVTDFTAVAERQTENFTGIRINHRLTAEELRLESSCEREQSSVNNGQIKNLNQTALRLLNGLISFKEEILKKVLSCEMFTTNYPLLIEHITREARLYRQYVIMLEEKGNITCKPMKETECFWNRIMMEHAMFIRGLLDPTEAELLNSANNFAKDYLALLEMCNNSNNKTLTSDSLNKTKKFRDFKVAGTMGIEQCKIRSIILPLLADHVLREANHYIRLLEN